MYVYCVGQLHIFKTIYNDLLCTYLFIPQF